MPFKVKFFLTYIMFGLMAHKGQQEVRKNFFGRPFGRALKRQVDFFSSRLVRQLDIIPTLARLEVHDDGHREAKHPLHLRLYKP